MMVVWRRDGLCVGEVLEEGWKRTGGRAWRLWRGGGGLVSEDDGGSTG